MAVPILGLILGIFIGFELPFSFSQDYSVYAAFGILACIDSVVGGIKAIISKNFNLGIFASGFFGNAVLSMVLVWVGNQLNIQLSIAAVVIFGSRLFQNFAIIRRLLLNKHKNEDSI